VGNRLISRKSIGNEVGREAGREKGLERLQKISARGAHCGDKRLGRRLSPGFKDKPLSRMEVDCALHNRQQWQSCAIRFFGRKE
jgi:hypothetical protein